jgi:hypothetical protein
METTNARKQEPIMTAITIELTELTSSDPIETNRALRADLAGRSHDEIATTEINGGDIAQITIDGEPMTVREVLADVDAFLADES